MHFKYEDSRLVKIKIRLLDYDTAISYVVTNVSEEHAVSVFRVEVTSIYSVITQKITIPVSESGILNFWYYMARGAQLIP